MKPRTFPGGIHPSEAKHFTEKKSIVKAAEPQTVVIPLQQHIGAPCKPLVKKGDAVKVGQRIGEPQGFVSSPVHSSVSGKVVRVEARPHPLGKDVLSVIIESDGQEEWSEEIKKPVPLEELSPRDILNIVQQAGIVGMGGATFPTHVKLSPPKEGRIDTLIVNGVECEPYLTADHRTMLEMRDRLVFGMKVLMKVLGADRGYIGIEVNKPDAIEVMEKALASESRLEVVPLKVKYPEGAEHQLIKAVLDKEIPSGGLPLHIGIVVQNVGTTVAIAEAVQSGKPLIERVLTVTGSGVKNPQNMLVKIGTLFSEVIDQCGGVNGQVGKVIMGGPMMGLAQYTADVPVIKGTSGILVLSKEEAKTFEVRPCIRCARCVDACPMYLMPCILGELIENEEIDTAEKEYSLMDCKECGICSYVCPAKRPLVQYMKIGKAQVMAKRKRG